MLEMTKERKARKLSMSALAATAHMHVSSVSQIESGRLKPYPGQVRKICAALEWQGDPMDLFKEVEER